MKKRVEILRTTVESGHAQSFEVIVHDLNVLSHRFFGKTGALLRKHPDIVYDKTVTTISLTPPKFIYNVVFTAELTPDQYDDWIVLTLSLIHI